MGRDLMAYIYKMVRVLISKESTPFIRKFLIPKKQVQNCDEWVEICINYAENSFLAKIIKVEEPGTEWIEYKDYTFPTSLFSEFLNNTHSKESGNVSK